MRAWERRGLLAILLLPLALVFAVLASLRRLMFRSGTFKTTWLPVPVVVVGNISVGGVGKTPLTIHLVEEFSRRGHTPGVISRGYGRSSSEVLAVSVDSPPGRVGDEPLLIARRTGAPVCVGSNRVAAARTLLRAHPDIDIILSDDGLQHYGLGRSFEIAVLDRRGVMNGWRLPAGPLREPVSRLCEVDALVWNGVADAVSPTPTFAEERCPGVFSMELTAGPFFRLGTPTVTASAERFRGAQVHALAGIGHPQRFFDQLAGMGISLIPHAFSDHYSYQGSDLPDDGCPILTTEKDAVKLAPLIVGKSFEIWVLPLQCSVKPDLVACILEKIDGTSPA